jgi:hypothetical protein
MKTNIKINERNKGFFIHKAPHGLNITKTKSQAMKDITEYIRSGNTDFGTMNYLPLERLILKLPKNENLVVSEKNIKKLPFIHCKENIRQKPTVEIYVKEMSYNEWVNSTINISTPKKQNDWFDFVLELSKKKIYKIFKNGEEVFKYQLFWAGVSVEDIFERKNGFDWNSCYWRY